MVIERHWKDHALEENFLRSKAEHHVAYAIFLKRHVRRALCSLSKKSVKKICTILSNELILKSIFSSALNCHKSLFFIFHQNEEEVRKFAGNRTDDESKISETIARNLSNASDLARGESEKIKRNGIGRERKERWHINFRICFIFLSRLLPSTRAYHCQTLFSMW